MDIKVIFSSGGKYNKNREQKLADNDTAGDAKTIVDALVENGHVAEMIKITPSKINTVNKLSTDVVFNLIEWTGRDYPLGVKVLKILESHKIPYTGGDSKSFEWSSDKISMKKMFDKLSIPTPPWTSISPKDSRSDIRNKINALTFPIIIKPAYEHCGIGINYESVIRSERKSVSKIVKLLNLYKEPVLVEEFIEGREFTTTVIKNHRLEIFPPAEVLFSTRNRNKLLSFATKWLNTGNEYRSIVLKDNDLSETLKKMSRIIFKKMDCKGYVRIDLRMDSRKKRLYVLEVNINPSIWPEKCYGLTVSTEAGGWNFNKLVDEIAKAAVTNSHKN